MFLLFLFLFLLKWMSIYSYLFVIYSVAAPLLGIGWMGLLAHPAGNSWFVHFFTARAQRTWTERDRLGPS